MNPLAAQLAIALCQNPANPVRNAQDALNLAECATVIAEHLENASDIDTTGAMTLQAPERHPDLMTVSELVEEFGVSRTSIKRLMNDYEEATGVKLHRLKNGGRVMPMHLLGEVSQVMQLIGAGTSRKAAWKQVLGG